MEKNSAASLQEWSIELEKGLRSKNPTQAISQIATRLKQWSQEPVSTAPPSIYNLIPGEDKLFTNTILLRLADAFVNNDNHIRVCILKAFSFLKGRGSSSYGFLCKDRVVNYKELLKRVKVVYDKEESVESRTICLRLLGYCSEIGCDSADMRYMVLSSLSGRQNCSDDLEVKAAVFAAGWFSQLCVDFGGVFLNVLVDKVNSVETSSVVKLACAKGFARLGCSFMLARRGYEKGREVMLVNSADEGFVVLMLVSLSILASKSMLLVSGHFELLLSFIGDNACVLRVKAMALRCMLFLLDGGVGRFPMNASCLSKLFDILNDEDLPLILQRQVLRVLLKVFQSAHPSLSCINTSNIVRWMSVVENATQSTVMSNRLLAFRLLVEIFLKYLETIETPSQGNGHLDVPSHVLLIVLDQTQKLVKLVAGHCETPSKLEQECQSLLSLVLRIIDQCPTLGGLALNKTKLCLESLLVAAGGVGDELGSSNEDIVILEGEKHCFFTSKFVLFVYKVVEHCIEILNESSAVTAEVHEIVKVIIGLMHKKFFLSRGVWTINLILLHFRVMWCYFANETVERSCVDSLGSPLTVYWIEHEKLTHQFIKKMIVEKDNWAAYKAGKLAACQGAWFAAAFSFRQLINTVQSNGCQQWFKSLALFSRSESAIILPFLPHQGQAPVFRSQIEEIWVSRCGLLEENVRGASCNSVLDDPLKSLSKAHGDVRSAVEMLVAAGTTVDAFFFQRWFLNIRAKVLQIVIDILRLLYSDAKEQNVDEVWRANGGPAITCGGPSLDAHYLTHRFTLVSFCLKSLAQELDLLAMSFMDMDIKSHRTISLLALNCSILAFCTGFALYFPRLHSHGSSLRALEVLNKCLHTALVQDLLNRLQHIDSEMTTNLMRVLALIGEPNLCVHMQPRAPVYKAGQRESEILGVCKFALSGFLGMLEDAKGTKEEGGLYHESKTRLELMSNVLKRWMNISFQVPKYFFRVRPCIGAELFVFNADTRNSNGLSVFPGFHLSLNLCLQLRHVPSSHATKVYCILASKPSDCEPGDGRESKGKEGMSFPLSDTNDTLDMNEKLWMHVREGANRGRKLCRTCSWDGLVYSYASFELNERGQGFASCLLDVSSFPVGSYKIKWQSCCTDTEDSYWSLVSLNMGPIFNIKKDSATC